MHCQGVEERERRHSVGQLWVQVSLKEEGRKEERRVGELKEDVPSAGASCAWEGYSGDGLD